MLSYHLISALLLPPAVLAMQVRMTVHYKHDGGVKESVREGSCTDNAAGELAGGKVWGKYHAWLQSETELRIDNIEPLAFEDGAGIEAAFMDMRTIVAATEVSVLDRVLPNRQLRWTNVLKSPH
ncbi:hypothetical protein K461DRAFT_296530 [Myriangium duriaei CBS 260.36]|uniref:Uncharacterized protein n=1 Tax=Myriangium duriaei CBS 260.36 TaxID=1168546 RepID=A0A9P4J0I4_9PEZI|nr:hypothetical protein K461DRAFT_296530 [Myriangium duriaei CBS 260.36]